MSKSIYQLEKDRKDKIKSLSLDEVKAYIENLNKKVFEAFEQSNSEKIDFYNEKLSEVFEVTKGKYVNLEFYSIGTKLDLTTSKLIEANTKKANVYVSLTTVALINADISLRELEHILDYLLMVYYHNYYLMESSIVEDLLIHLEFEYNFKDEKFCEYANSRVRKYNETLIRELNFLIGMIKETIGDVCKLADSHISENYEKEIEGVFKQIEDEKDYVLHNPNCMKSVKEGDYLNLLDGLKDSYEALLESVESYISIKDRLQKFINSEDGFADCKEAEYEIANENGGVFSDKEDYIAMRPSYNMKECEFVESTYFDDLKSENNNK